MKKYADYKLKTWTMQLQNISTHFSSPIPLSIPHHARKASAVRIDLALVVKDIDELQSVALTALEIVRVVRRRDLDRAGAECHVDQL